MYFVKVLVFSLEGHNHGCLMTAGKESGTGYDQ